MCTLVINLPHHKISIRLVLNTVDSFAAAPIHSGPIPARSKENLWWTAESKREHSFDFRLFHWGGIGCCREESEVGGKVLGNGVHDD